MLLVMEAIVTAMEAVQLTVVVAAAKMAMGRERLASCLLCLDLKKKMWREVGRSRRRSKMERKASAADMAAT